MTPEQYWDNEAIIDPRYANGKWHINLGDDPDEILLEVLRNIWPYVPIAGHVIEIGCGPGRLLVPTAMNFPNTQFLGLDVSRLMLQFATARVALLDNVTLGQLIQNEVRTHEPWTGPPIDLVYMVEVVQHIDDDEFARHIRSSYEALHVGGHFVAQFVNDLSGRPWEPYSYPRGIHHVRQMIDEHYWAKRTFEGTSLHPEWTWVIATK